MKIPVKMPSPLVEIAKEINQDLVEENEPTAEQIHAAIERAEKAQTHGPLIGGAHKPKKRQFVKRKKNDSSNT